MGFRGVFFAILFAAAFPAWSQQGPSHRLAPDTQHINLAGSVGLLEDAEGKLDAAQVAAIAERGGMRQVAFPKSPVLRATAAYTFWLKVDLSADAGAQPDWMLVIGAPVFDRIQVFTRSPAGEWVGSAIVGAALPMSARPLRNRNAVLPVRVVPGQVTAVLVRIQDHGARPLRMALWQREALSAADQNVVGGFAAYFGLLGGMILYNLLLFVVVRDRGFLLYVGLFLFYAIGMAGNTGLGAQYAWGEWPWLQYVATTFGYAVATVFSVLLTRHFLSTRQWLPLVDKAMLAVACAAFAVAAASVMLPRFAVGTSLVLVSFASSLLSSGLAIFAVVRRRPGAAYFLAACVSFHFLNLVALASFLKIIPWSFTSPEISVVGSALEMILLSLALADRINEERRQKERAQAGTLAVLEASHALGSETRLDRLHARLGEILAAVTGAGRVHFILRDSGTGRWFVHVAQQGRVDVEAPEQARSIPLTALREVERNPRPLLIDDAVADARFAGDAALAQAACCSLLVLPVFHQGALRAMLVLENRDRTGAFSHVAQQTVEAIAGPLAVSLENVLLYENLERRVAEQTRELRETQERLVATARRAGMAEIATNVLHNVGNTLNSVNVAADLIRKQVAASRISGLARTVDLLASAGADPGGFIRDNPKGRLIPGYLAQLSAALERERQEVFEHLARLATSVGHIKNVVAMQQSYAGTSVMQERVEPRELMEDALRMASTEQHAESLQVVRDFADVPQVCLDKARTVQILVNLVTNARQAMQDAFAKQRTLTLRLEADDATLRFVVQDRGCGIPPENLSRIFSHGFSTRSGGHGFGLHSSALAAGEMGGSLTVHSEGAGHGATFVLALPFVPA